MTTPSWLPGNWPASTPVLVTDGGLVGSNPSPLGGTWAWAAGTLGGEITDGGGGVFLAQPDTRVLTRITNNQMELLAMGRALATVPDGWTGLLVSDSAVALNWLQEVYTVRSGPSAALDAVAAARYVPRPWLRALRTHFLRLSDLTLVPITGHPTARERLARVGRRGPIHPFNWWADAVCTHLAMTYRTVGDTAPYRLCPVCLFLVAVAPGAPPTTRRTCADCLRDPTWATRARLDILTPGVV